MTQPIKIEIHLHIHDAGGVTIDRDPFGGVPNVVTAAGKTKPVEINLHIHADGSVSVGQTGMAGGSEAGATSVATTLKTPASPPAVKTQPAEPPPAPAPQVDVISTGGEAAAADRNPNILRKALYDASERAGKDAALGVVARLAGGSLRNVTDSTFDSVLNELNALQKE